MPAGVCAVQTPKKSRISPGLFGCAPHHRQDMCGACGLGDGTKVRRRETKGLEHETEAEQMRNKCKTDAKLVRNSDPV